MTRRDEILDAAWALVARDGAAPAAAIAREAALSKALLFHHFGDLAGLHDAMAEKVLRETQRGLDALADEVASPRERLAALVAALLAEPPEAPANARNVLRFWLDSEGRATPRAALRDSLLADFIAKTMKDARSKADARAVASLLLARWHGATVVYASGGYVDFEAERERTLRELETLL